MSTVKELEKRVDHLETEVDLLKELVKLQSKCPERLVPIPSAPLQPYYGREPSLEPPHKFTCGCGKCGR